MPRSRYVLIVEGLSSSTRSKDIRHIAEKYGSVIQVMGMDGGDREKERAVNQRETKWRRIVFC